MYLKKELKRARLFEVQKIIKRLRALQKRRGTEVQLEKNRRKITRLQRELHLVKEINIADLCSRFIARDEAITQLASQQQPPGEVKEKAEWRLLTSKKVYSCLRELMESSGAVEKCNDTGQDKILEQGMRSSQLDRSWLQDGEVKSVSKPMHKASRASAMSSGQTRDRLTSVFLTSLSAVSGTGYLGGEGIPCKRKKSNTAKRNRPGQRSRRKLWEEKYGSEAKHLIKTGSKRKHAAPDDADKEQTSKSDTGDDLHPSWAAKRQLETGIKQFQGQKIVFD